MKENEPGTAAVRAKTLWLKIRQHRTWLGVTCVSIFSLAAIAGWGVSYRYPCCAGWAILERRQTWLTKGYQIAFGRGQLELSCVTIQLWEDAERTRQEFLETGAQPVVGWYDERRQPDAVAMSCIPIDPFWNRLGIYRTSDSALAGDSNSPTGIVLPFWLVTFLCISVSAPFYRRAFRRYQINAIVRRGGCRTCGYDLRHSGAICSECGSPRPGPNA